MYTRVHIKMMKQKFNNLVVWIIRTTLTIYNNRIPVKKMNENIL